MPKPDPSPANGADTLKIALIAGICVAGVLLAMSAFAPGRGGDGQAPRDQGPTTPEPPPSSSGRFPAHPVPQETTPAELTRPPETLPSDFAAFQPDENAARAAFAQIVKKVGDNPRLGLELTAAFRAKYGHTRFLNDHLADMTVLWQAGAAVRHLIHRQDHYYLLVRDAVFWQTAKFRCEQLGGHLLTVTSRAEHSFANQFLRPTRRGNPPGIWLGATDEGHEGKWTWVSGEKWSYAAWTAGEPNNAGGREHWAELGAYPARQWNDIDAAEPYWFVCEWEKKSPQFTLNGLRELIATVSPTVWRPAVEYKKRLARSISCTAREVPLPYAVIAVLNRADIPYQWEKSSRALGPAASPPVDVNADAIPASEALDRILAPLRLEYEIDNLGLFVTPAAGTNAE